MCLHFKKESKKAKLLFFAQTHKRNIFFQISSFEYHSYRVTLVATLIIVIIIAHISSSEEEKYREYIVVVVVKIIWRVR